MHKANGGTYQEFVWFLFSFFVIFREYLIYQARNMVPSPRYQNQFFRMEALDQYRQMMHRWNQNQGKKSILKKWDAFFYCSTKFKQRKKNNFGAFSTCKTFAFLPKYFHFHPRNWLIFSVLSVVSRIWLCVKITRKMCWMVFN